MQRSTENLVLNLTPSPPAPLWGRRRGGPELTLA